MKPMEVVIYSRARVNTVDEGEALMCFKKDEEGLKKIWFQPGRQLEDYDRRVSSFGEGDVFFFHPGPMGICKVSLKLPYNVLGTY